jgi:signal transduction histidine kinase/DNA-binding response OmpR family regulator
VKVVFIDSYLMSRLRLAFFCCLLLFCVAAQAQATAAQETGSAMAGRVAAVDLSAEELAWIKAHPVIRVGAEMDWPPFDHVEQNRATGFSNDYLRLLAGKVGLDFEFVHGFTWSELLRMAREKQLDVLPAVWKNPERTAFLEFTQSYYESKNVIVVREDSQGIDALEHLEGKTLAGVKDYNITLAIAKDFPDIQIMLVDSPLEALVAVGNGSADAYVDQLAVVNYIRRKNLILGLKTSAVVDIPTLKGSEPLYFAVRKDWPVLARILDKAMDAVSVEEYQDLKMRWLAPPRLQDGTRGILLTSDDKQFLSSLGTLRIGVEQKFRPLEFVNEVGQHQGLSSDYVSFMRKQLGIEVELVLGGTQQQLINKLQQGEIDVLPGLHMMSPTDEVSHFSRPYAQFPVVIATRLDAPHVRNLGYLEGKSVGVVDGCMVQDALGAKHPGLDLQGYPDLESALLALEDGEVFAVVDNSATITYEQGRLGLAAIKIIPFSTPYAMKLSMGVREGLAPLAVILDRMIASMGQDERNILADRWISMPVEVRTDWQKVWQAVSLVIAVAALIIIVIMRWNRRLANEISAREVLETKLMSAMRQAEEASKAKSEFVATLSHEIRTPMNGVLGMTYLLADTKLTSVQRDYLNVISQSGQALMGILNDILDFSKIEAGKMRLEPIPFNLEAEGHKVIQLLMPRAEEKGVELIFDYAPGCPRHLVGDPGRIRQVMTNLVSNAVKFTESGHVMLHIGCVGISDGRAQMEIAVEDTGPGIGEEHQQRLFGSFTQLNSSTTRKYGGTGLGLTICKKLVLLMGGEIGLESEEGRGSTFWCDITLPLADMGIPLPEDALADVSALVLAGEEVACWMLERQLRHLGIRTATTRSDEQGLLELQDAAHKGDPYQVAILCCQGPEVDVISFADRVGNHAELQRLPLVVMNCSDQPETLDDFIAAGVAVCLAKPLSSGTLQDCLLAVLGRQPDAHQARLDVPPRTATGPEGQVISSTKPKNKGRVLLAEDVLLNQKVAVSMLQQLGVEVEIAVNGEDAVQQWSKGDFDMIFMDCRMPVMDGYEATRQIRKMETEGRIPIIAFTANAFNEDRQRCMDAGMDDFIPKPYTMGRLKAVLEKWLEPQTASDTELEEQTDVATSTKESAAPLNLDFLEQMRGMLAEDFDELIPAFMTSARKVLGDLPGAVTDNNSEEVARLAHSLKSASANVGADALSEMADAMEAAAGRGDMADMEPAIRRLVSEFERVREALLATTGA